MLLLNFFCIAFVVAVQLMKELQPREMEPMTQVQLLGKAAGVLLYAYTFRNGLNQLLLPSQYLNKYSGREKFL